MNWEIPDIQDEFRKGRGTIDQITNICLNIGKAREFLKKKIYFCFIDYIRAFNGVDDNKLENSWKKSLFNLYVEYIMQNAGLDEA